MEGAGPGSAAGAWRPILAPGLRAVFVGFNPSPRASELGHYYAHPRNRFWELLAESGLTALRLRPQDDGRLPEFGLGLTDVVGRATAGASDLAPAELRAGGADVRRRLAAFRPRFAAYTGKGVYRAVSGCPAAYGLAAGQAVDGVADFVLPSPSGRSGLRWAEKLAWYRALAAALAEEPVGRGR